jgi:hypothetical protein
VVPGQPNVRIPGVEPSQEDRFFATPKRSSSIYQEVDIHRTGVKRRVVDKTEHARYDWVVAGKGNVVL